MERLKLIERRIADRLCDYKRSGVLYEVIGNVNIYFAAGYNNCTAFSNTLVVSFCYQLISAGFISVVCLFDIVLLISFKAGNGICIDFLTCRARLLLPLLFTCSNVFKLKISYFKLIVRVSAINNIEADRLKFIERCAADRLGDHEFSGILYVVVGNVNICFTAGRDSCFTISNTAVASFGNKLICTCFRIVVSLCNSVSLISFKTGNSVCVHFLTCNAC